MAGLYVHIPFCRPRCVYCDFYFVTGHRDHSAFVEAITKEIRQSASQPPIEPLSTIYLGGGTPSRLASHDVDAILKAIRSAFDTSGVTEITMELNPEDSTRSYLQALKDLGINRVSMGVQSFFDDELQFMNRSHSADQANSALVHIAEAGFESYTADLIFGLPGQPNERWAENLNRLMAFDVPHVSTYALTVEEKTPLHKQIAKGLITPAADGVVSEHYQTAMDMLRDRGFEHYEISSFARPGHRSRHNSQYWTHANYLGLGPSAHSFWWDRSKGACRWNNIRNLRKYVLAIRSGTSTVAYREALTSKILALERIMLSLRTTEGLDLKMLNCTYGVDLIALRGPIIDKLSKAGLIQGDRKFLSLTDRGKHLCDSVVARLAPW